MGLDLNAVAAAAARAKGADAKAVGALPDTADEFIAQLVDDEVLNVGQATALRLLVAKAKVEAVAESVRRAAAGEATADDAAVVAAVDQSVDSTAEVIEDRPPAELEAEARAFDAEIEQRRRHDEAFERDLDIALEANGEAAWENEGGGGWG